MFWVALLVIIPTFVFVFWGSANEAHIRIAGLILQCLGLSTVVLGLNQTRKLFKKPSTKSLVRAWISRIPRWHGRIVMGAGTTAIAVSGVEARGYVWNKVDPISTIEDRISAMGKNVDRLNERLIAVENEIAGESRKQSDALEDEQRLRGMNDQQLEKQLDAAQTGGIILSFVGVVWLFLGLILSTISPELARWLH